MIIPQENKNVETSGVKSTHSFRIKSTGKAFRTLSDYLYSDKITAVIREISSNAHDSHITAKTQRPFTVHLPTDFEPWFSVRDYGIGLSHKDVTTIFVTYFQSTKDESNDVVGCLGLGSKTPFSYTDNFTVTSYFNGECRIYSCFINSEDEPDISLMDKSKTDEPNGLEVKFAVRSENFFEFKNKAEEVFKYFKQKPEIIGESIEIPEYQYDLMGEGWGYRNAYSYSYSNRGAKAIQGCVAYPLHDLSSPLLSDLHKQVLKNEFIIEFNIGELEVAASREKLSYKPKTVDAIIKRLDTIIQEIQDRVSEDIKNCKSLYEARCIIRELSNGKYSAIKNLFSTMSFAWNGQPVTTVNIDIAPLCSDMNYVLRFYRGTPVTKERISHIVPSNDLVFYFSDLTKGSYCRAAKLTMEVPDKQVLLIKSDIASDFVQKFKELLGIDPNHTFTNISTVAWDKNKDNIYEANPLNGVKLLKWNFISRKWEDSSASFKDFKNQTGPYYYVPVHRYKINGTSSIGYIGSGLTVLDTIGEKFTGTIFGVKTSQVYQVSNNPQWVKFNVFVFQRLKEYYTKIDNLQGTLTDKFQLQNYKNNSVYHRSICYIAESMKSAQVVVPSLIQTYVDRINIAANIAHNTDLAENLIARWGASGVPEIDKYFDTLGVYKIDNFNPTPNQKGSFQIDEENIINTYPLLTVMDYWDISRTTENTKKVIDYIMMIDNFNSSATIAP